MAGSIADMLVQGTIQAGQKAGDDIKTGAQLAQTVEQIASNRAMLEQKRQELQMQKVEKLTTAMEVGAKMKSKSARNAYFKNYIPNMQNALGLQDFIPQETMAMIQADPEQAKKFSLLKTKIFNGDMTYDQAVATMEPEEWAMLDDSEVVQLEAAEKFRVQQGNTTARAGMINNRSEGQFDITQYQKVKDDFEANTKESRSALTNVMNAKGLLEVDGPISSEAVKTQLARLTGEKGPLTDQDVARFGGSRDLISRFETTVERLASGKITPETKAEYQKIIGEFGSVLRAKIAEEEDRQVASAEALGLDGNRARKVLSASMFRKEAKKSGGDEWKKKIVGQRDAYLKLSPELKQKYIDGAAKKFGKSPEEIKKELGE
jgi:hypothetical protein